MMKGQHILFSKHGLTRRALAGVCFAFLLMASPVKSFAQCEANGVAGAEVGVLINAQDAAILNPPWGLIPGTEWGGVPGTPPGAQPGTPVPGLSWYGDLTALQNTLGTMGRDQIMAKFNEFWSRWGGAWQDMTKQLSSATLDQSRELGRINDAENELTAALDEQKERVKSQSLYQPTDQACRFDTTAFSMTPSQQTSAAMENGFEWDFVQLGNNEKPPVGSTDPLLGAAQYGPAAVQDILWSWYQTNFCDYLAENGNAGCANPTYPQPLPPNGPYPPPGPNDPNMQMNADLDALPSDMLFSQFTIDIFNPVALQAMKQMMFNITGYKVPDPMLPGAMRSVSGMDQTLVRRRYITQMDAVGSLLYSLMADRMPGPLAPDIYNLRVINSAVPPNILYSVFMAFAQILPGMPVPTAWVQAIPPLFMQQASPTPSPREIRQSIIEQLWDPNYYKNLYDNPSTIGQKEVYLKAYSLVMLNEMISKQERISNAYAIETSNILSHTAGVLANTHNQPVQ